MLCRSLCSIPLSNAHQCSRVLLVATCVCVYGVQGPVEAGAAELWAMEALPACGSAKSCLPAPLLALAASQTHTPTHHLLSSTLQVLPVVFVTDLGRVSSAPGGHHCDQPWFSPVSITARIGPPGQSCANMAMQRTSQASNFPSKKQPPVLDLSPVSGLKASWSALTSSALLLQLTLLPALSHCKLRSTLLFRHIPGGQASEAIKACAGIHCDATQGLGASAGRRLSAGNSVNRQLAEADPWQGQGLDEVLRPVPPTRLSQPSRFAVPFQHSLSCSSRDHSIASLPHPLMLRLEREQRPQLLRVLVLEVCKYA